MGGATWTVLQGSRGPPARLRRGRTGQSHSSTAVAPQREFQCLSQAFTRLPADGDGDRRVLAIRIANTRPLTFIGACLLTLARRASFTARVRRATVRIMGAHDKPPTKPQPQPSNDPPGNSDGQSEVSKPGSGDHRKPPGK